MPEILVQDVTVRYGSKVALDGVSVQLRDRSVSGLVGVVTVVSTRKPETPGEAECVQRGRFDC